jgi:glycosyltransferase involved in cell wall biosynthesis
MTISAFLPVYNEEKRIKTALISLMWCDEIILIDKYSSDKTVEIAREFGDKVKISFIENSSSYDASEWQEFLNRSTSEWAIFFTASDLIQPNLANEILKKIRNPNFKYSVLLLPFSRQVLGINSKRSPWHTQYSPKVIRKDCIRINLKGVHNVVDYTGKEYKIPRSVENQMFHLTHESVDTMMERHVRYWKGETKMEIDLSKDFKHITKEIFRILFLKKTFLLGRDGIAIAFAYLSYFMMSYVYRWEKKYSKAKENYSSIRSKINNQWKNNVH